MWTPLMAVASSHRKPQPEHETANTSEALEKAAEERKKLAQAYLDGALAHALERTTGDGSPPTGLGAEKKASVRRPVALVRQVARTERLEQRLERARPARVPDAACVGE